jgi:hypothetical protein
VSLTEYIESVQWFGQRLEFRTGPGFDARVLVGRPQHEVSAVRVVERPERGAEWRRDGYAPLGVEPVLVRAEKLHHASL